MAWLRARLPGYPAFPAPQLARGTPPTTPKFGSRLTWLPGERAQGLQFQPAPPDTAEALEAINGERHEIDETTRSVATALEGTDEFRRLDIAGHALDGHAREALQHARAGLKARLTDQAVNAYEPGEAFRRNKYRELTTSAEIDRLSGAAREYADAFDDADRLIETAASDVFGQLACFGEPLNFAQPADVTLLPGPPPSVEFTPPTTSGRSQCPSLGWTTTSYRTRYRSPSSD